MGSLAVPWDLILSDIERSSSTPLTFVLFYNLKRVKVEADVAIEHKPRYGVSKCTVRFDEWTCKGYEMGTARACIVTDH